MTNVEVWLWILLVMLPHNSRTTELLSRYRTGLEAAIAMRDGKCELLNAAERQRVERTRTREVKALIAQCEHLGIRMITLDDPEYPSQLKRIDDPPIVLFVKGDISQLNRMPAVAVVGPRVPSDYGMRITDVLCNELAAGGVGIVSGMAVGIDAQAHRSAVEHGGYTVGVMGCGLEVNYPADNEQLKKDVIASGGALVSELLPYSSASVPYFRRRNRIIAGLSSASVVIEASAKSGALVTAGITRTQGKPVFCVPPHDITDGSFNGSVSLLREYALPLFGISDIFTELSRRGEDGEHIAHMDKVKELSKKSVAPKPKKSAKAAPMLESIHEEPHAVEFVDVSELSPEEAAVILLLKERPLTMDEIIEKSGKRHDEICSIILGLELMDAVERRQDGTFILP